jgi:hypothetical protein
VAVVSSQSPPSRGRAFRLAVILILALFHAGAARGAEPAAEFFSLAQVRLLGGPFKDAQEVDRRYILQLDPDRLLASFRVEARLEPKAPLYGNWEGTGLNGHTAGHYLTALAQMAAATGDPEIRRRLDYMISELAECQRSNGNGYVGGTPGGRQLWTEIGAGNIRARPFDLNGKWVPWYNLHKLFAGLRDAWLIGGNAQARDVLIRLADWCDELASHLTDDRMQSMLRSEHGGMNEVLADVSAIAGDAKYLDLARRFSDRALLEALAAGRDTLTGMHANTQIPKVVGYQRIHELSGDPEMGAAARFFWDVVTRRRSVAIGGNSIDEHFNPVDDFARMIADRTGVETCNSYNMLRLTERLFRETPDARLADYYERALYNHILSSQHPDDGGFVYFTPMHPGHYRVYSRPETAFWCCVGSGMENHGKYGRFIYAHTDDSVYVNLFVASELNWEKRGLKLRQTTHFPDAPETRLRFSLHDPTSLTLRLRRPAWVADAAPQIMLNGKALHVVPDSTAYIAISRIWRDGDTVELRLPMRTTLERLPDGSAWGALLHGPIVLAAVTGRGHLDGLRADDGRWGHRADGPLPPLEEAPALAADPARIDALVRRVPGRPLAFVAPDAIAPEAMNNLELVPFFRVHDARYVIYWRLVPPQ